ncbi:hypothetical protein FRC12_003848 [Ceratobasidium sp. 428]|nr:hypothetical protein FRC12_003848 [Ceratobasidium sp. 428]
MATSGAEYEPSHTLCQPLHNHTPGPPRALTKAICGRNNGAIPTPSLPPEPLSPDHPRTASQNEILRSGHVGDCQNRYRALITGYYLLTTCIYASHSRRSVLHLPVSFGRRPT